MIPRLLPRLFALAALALVLTLGASCSADPRPSCSLGVSPGDFFTSVTTFGIGGQDCKPESLDPSLIEEGMADGGACSAAPGDGNCVLCLKASCCAPSLACSGACTCYAAHRYAGETAEEASAACGPPDVTYQALGACSSSACAAACPRFP